MRSKSKRRETNRDLLGAPVTTRPIDECLTMHEAFMALPRACGASTQSAAYQILYRAIVEEVPLSSYGFGHWQFEQSDAFLD